MKRTIAIVVAFIVLLAVMVTVVARPPKDGRDESKGHARQAFLGHVGTVLVARNPLSKGSSQALMINLSFIDERRISEFSELSNIGSVFLICEDGTQLQAQAFKVSEPRPMSTIPAGRVYETEHGTPLFMRHISLGIDPGTLSGEKMAIRIRVTFADGVVEEFPVGRFRLKSIPDDQVLVGAYTSCQFLSQRSTLTYEGQEFQLDDAPRGMHVLSLGLRVPFPEGSIDNGYGIGSGSRLLDVDIGVEGLSVDWSHPVYVESMKRRPVVDQAAQKEFTKDKEESPELEWDADSYFDAILSVTDKVHYSREEVETLDPSLFLPEEFYIFKRGRVDGRFPGVPEPSALPRDMDGIPALEAWYPVYYDPDSDFSNTVIFFQPAMTVASGAAVKYRINSFSPRIIPPARYADLGALLDAQNP